MKTLEEMKYNYILKVLTKCDGNRRKAAKILGVSSRTMSNYLPILREMYPDDKTLYPRKKEKGSLKDFDRIESMDEYINKNYIL